jgi:plastocyanin
MMLVALLAIPSLPMQSVDYVVQIGEKNYHPDNLEVRVGDRVTWKNFDAQDHTATAEVRSRESGSQEPLFDSDRIPSGGSFSYVFVREGSVRYSCKLHDGPSGFVVVRPAR